jgi:hypothetical protein
MQASRKLRIAQFPDSMSSDAGKENSSHPSGSCTVRNECPCRIIPDTEDTLNRSKIVGSTSAVRAAAAVGGQLRAHHLNLVHSMQALE